MIDTSRVICAITSVNTDTATAVGHNPQMGNNMAVSCMLQPGGNLCIPAVGEQWIVEKIGTLWYLYAKTDYQDKRQHLPYEQGMTALGSSSGPTYVSGTKVIVDADIADLTYSDVYLPGTTRLGDYQVRVDPTTGLLQVRPPGQNTSWANVDSPQQAAPTQTQLVTKLHKYRLALNVGTRNIASGTYTQVPFGVRTGDDDSGVFSLNSSGTGELTCLKAGRYFIQFRSSTDTQAGVASSTFYGYVYINGNLVIRKNGGPSGSWFEVDIDEYFDLKANDKITCKVYYLAGSGESIQRTFVVNDTDAGGNALNQLAVSYLG